MNNYAFYTLDVFTEQIFGGNPLAVFPDAQGLTASKMQAIAKEFNLSETVFVLPSEQPDCDFQLRIFTPHAEIPFAGHPTVGTAYLLAHLGFIPTTQTQIFLEEGVGTIPVAIAWENNRVKTTALSAAQMPVFSEVPAVAIAELLNLTPADSASDRQPAVISCGLSFFYIPLASEAALHRCSLNLALWEKALKNTEAANIYPFFVAENQTIYARMFAPALGITEDPATGSAATALAGYLAKYYPVATPENHWQIYQGIEMGRPSQIRLSFQSEADQVNAISVAGATVLVSEGTLGL
ncbi:PhzF family phenazine biosynthesis protein [Picosynechococcus sp. NKBG15041c]|uniref:PhzF family phenazine biosynthesis protein n=1 Tax=Picosynechococcus sp. NKBG15041c TaxID=1407650 RepID=UPI0003F7237C|nr:PhzF family phenazine biosynthesis protein [Picosynechococcus sp. NKBG15041c]